MSSGPRAAEGVIICGTGAAPYGGCMDGPGGGKTSARSGAYWGTGVSGRWPLLGSLRTRRLMILTDRLGSKVAFFWSWLLRRSEMVNGVGEENCRRIIHHPPVGRYRLVQRSLCLCRGEKEGIGEEALVIAQPGWLPTWSTDARFLPAASSLVRVVRQLDGPAPPALFPVLGTREGTGLRGLDSRDCWS